MDPSMDPTAGMDPNSLASMYRGAAAEGQFLVSGGAGLAAAATLAVFLRYLARWKNKMALGADDICIAASLIPIWCLVLVSVLLVQQGGMGLPAEFLSSSQSYVFYRILFASFILYAIAITTAKISILLMYRRIFKVTSFRYAIYIVGGLCMLWFVVVVLVSLFQCTPVSFAWDKTIQGHCIDLKTMYYGFTISNMVLDIVVNFMPAHMIWKLQLPLKQRILLEFIMMLGIIVVVASVGRIASVKDLTTNEVSATILMPFLYTIIEPAFAIICTCIVTYRPIIILIAGKISYLHWSSKSWFRGRQGSYDTETSTDRRPSIMAKLRTWSMSSSVPGGSRNSVKSEKAWPLPYNTNSRSRPHISSPTLIIQSTLSPTSPYRSAPAPLRSAPPNQYASSLEGLENTSSTTSPPSPYLPSPLLPPTTTSTPRRELSCSKQEYHGKTNTIVTTEFDDDSYSDHEDDFGLISYTAPRRGRDPFPGELSFIIIPLH